MRNTLLAVVGFAIVMTVVLTLFADEESHEGITSEVVKKDLAKKEAIIIEETVSLGTARQAFWLGDMQQAENLYLKIIAINVDNINAWGELGNIYYMQAKWTKAANAYAEVALQLINNNDTSQAVFFYHLINQMDRAEAKRVSKRLEKANNLAQIKF